MASFRTASRLSLAVLIFLSSHAVAQVPTEFWPELDIFWRPALHQRTFLEVSGSADHEAAKREATVGLYQDYLNLPSLYLRAGYRYTFTTRDASYRESRVVGEAVVSRNISERLRIL